MTASATGMADPGPLAAGPGVRTTGRQPDAAETVATRGGSAPAITVRGLRKSYRSFEAVRGIDLDVARGEILAFLGPNGAGKTTTVEILEGFRTRSAGEVKVLGVDPAGAGSTLRSRVGVVLQESSPGCRARAEPGTATASRGEPPIRPAAR